MSTKSELEKINRMRAVKIWKLEDENWQLKKKVEALLSISQGTPAPLTDEEKPPLRKISFGSVFFSDGSKQTEIGGKVEMKRSVEENEAGDGDEDVEEVEEVTFQDLANTGKGLDDLEDDFKVGGATQDKCGYGGQTGGKTTPEEVQGNERKAKKFVQELFKPKTKRMRTRIDQEGNNAGDVEENGNVERGRESDDSRNVALVSKGKSELGDLVTVSWGGIEYDCKVVAVEALRVKVHYLKYSSGYDEWVLLPGKPACGEIAFGQDGNKKTAKHKAARSKFTPYMFVLHFYIFYIFNLLDNISSPTQTCLTSLMETKAMRK